MPPQDRDFLPVLLALAKLACGPVDAASGTDGSAGTNRGKKVAAVGLVDPPAHAISAAVSCKSFSLWCSAFEAQGALHAPAVHTFGAQEPENVRRG